jgi:hypothetical protein
MGELEVAELTARGHRARLDEPWQHYHFAGRADVISWDTDVSAFLHIENRTQYPDLQDAFGSFNNKQRYLVEELWRQLGFERPPRTQLHVMVALWSSEVLRVLRQKPSSFRATFPDPPDAFLAWLQGTPPVGLRATSFVLFDPLATGKQRRFLGLEEALAGARPRVRGYAEAAELLRRRG